MILAFPGPLWRLHRLPAAWEEASSPASGPGVLLLSSQGHVCRLTLFTAPTPRPCWLTPPRHRRALLCALLTLFTNPHTSAPALLAHPRPRHRRELFCVLQTGHPTRPASALVTLCIYRYLKYFTVGPFSNLSHLKWLPWSRTHGCLVLLHASLSRKALG